MSQEITQNRPSTGVRPRRRRLRLGGTAALAATALLGLTAVQAAAAPRTTAPVAAEPTAWVVASPGGDTALVGIDVATHAVVSSITLPTSLATNVGNTAGALAISPNGKTAYLAVEWAREVVPVNLTNEAIGKAIKVGNNPVSLAVTPNGARVYVLGFVNLQAASVVAIDTTTDRAAKPVSVGPLESAGEGGIAITPNGDTVWVSSAENGTVTAISTKSGKAAKPILVGAFPTSLAVTPNGGTLWVANTQDDDIVPVNLGTLSVGKKVRLGGAPTSLSITPSGQYAFATLGSPASGADRVKLSGSHTVTKVRLVDATKTPLQVDAVAVDPAGGTAFFCATSEATLAAASTGTGAEIAPIPMAAGVSGISAIAVTPDQAPTARLTSHVSGHTVSLNAASSSAWFGTVAHYAWRFGDGASAIRGPAVSHTYAKAGTYTVTLVVTDSLGTSTTVVFTGQTVSRNGGRRAGTSISVKIS